MRVGMRREHHEVMVVVTAGLIEGRKRISMTAAFADVGKVVAEMLSRFEFNFFPTGSGIVLPTGFPAPRNRTCLVPMTVPDAFVSNQPISLIAFGSADVVNWSSKVAFNPSYSEERWRK